MGNYVQNVSYKHFAPTFIWKIDTQGEYKRTTLDKNSKMLFLNDSRWVIRAKFLLLNIYTPILHGLLLGAQVIFSCLKSFYDLCNIIIDDKKFFYHNTLELLKNILKILVAPLLLITLQLTAVLGLLFPLNARKIYGNIERLMVNNFEVHKFHNHKLTTCLRSLYNPSKDSIINVEQPTKDPLINVDQTRKNNKFVLAPCFQPYYSL